MKYTKKLMVVPFKSEIKDTYINKINELNDGMSKAITHNSTPIDQRLKLYNQTMRKFISLYNPHSYNRDLEMININKRLINHNELLQRQLKQSQVQQQDYHTINSLKLDRMNSELMEALRSIQDKQQNDNGVTDSLKLDQLYSELMGAIKNIQGPNYSSNQLDEAPYNEYIPRNQDEEHIQRNPDEENTARNPDESNYFDLEDLDGSLRYLAERNRTTNTRLTLPTQDNLLKSAFRRHRTPKKPVEFQSDPEDIDDDNQDNTDENSRPRIKNEPTETIGNKARGKSSLYGIDHLNILPSKTRTRLQFQGKGLIKKKKKHKKLVIPKFF